MPMQHLYILVAKKAASTYAACQHCPYAQIAEDGPISTQNARRGTPMSSAGAGDATNACIRSWVAARRRSIGSRPISMVTGRPNQSFNHLHVASMAQQYDRIAHSDISSDAACYNNNYS